MNRLLKAHTRDLRMSVLLSFAGGVLLGVAVFMNDVPYKAMLAVASVVGFPVIGFTGALSFFALSGRIPVFSQIARFCVVGFLSTAIEIAVINALFLITGHTSGFYFSLFKTFTFLLALLNGYIFNKLWTFGSAERKVHVEFSKYAGVNLVGIVLNVGTASFIVNGIGAPGGFSGAAWANIGVITAVFIVMVWNFASYRFFVFKDANTQNNREEKGTGGLGSADA